MVREWSAAGGGRAALQRSGPLEALVRRRRTKLALTQGLSDGTRVSVGGRQEVYLVVVELLFVLFVSKVIRVPYVL